MKLFSLLPRRLSHFACNLSASDKCGLKSTPRPLLMDRAHPDGWRNWQTRQP